MRAPVEAPDLLRRTNPTNLTSLAEQTNERRQQCLQKRMHRRREQRKTPPQRTRASETIERTCQESPIRRDSGCAGSLLLVYLLVLLCTAESHCRVPTCSHRSNASERAAQSRRPRLDPQRQCPRAGAWAPLKRNDIGMASGESGGAPTAIAQGSPDEPGFGAPFSIDYFHENIELINIYLPTIPRQHTSRSTPRHTLRDFARSYGAYRGSLI